MKRELTRARSKLEEEKSIRGNIQVLPFAFLTSALEDHQFVLGAYLLLISDFLQADLEQYQERVRVCMESMDRCFV